MDKIKISNSDKLDEINKTIESILKTVDSLESDIKLIRDVIIPTEKKIEDTIDDDLPKSWFWK
tara:strand:- start:125 stop:313 length:189 start_codon:yes stop_codon:yes gene_type:complete